MTNTNTAISRGEIVAAANSIEPRPAALTRLLDLLASDDFDAARVVEIVSHDPALAGDVLARANSAASSAQRHIGDLREATTRVGSREVLNIAMRRAMRQQFVQPLPAYGMGGDQLWRHSLIASVAADVVQKKASVPMAPMISTAALVHDVGKLVIARCIPATFIDALLGAAETDSITIDEAERQVLGLDHGEVSGVVARTWGLPVSVQIALTQHHGQSINGPFGHALVLANKIAHAVDELDEESDAEDDPSPVVKDAESHLEACGISTADLSQMVIDSADSAAEILTAYEG